MTKYTILKDKPDGYGGNIPEIKIVKRSELKVHLKKGWYITDKNTPIITPIKKWWNKYNTDQKLIILSFLIPSLIAVFFGFLAYQSDKENDSLKLDNKTLNENYNQLRQTLTLTADSLNTERENSENLLQQLTSKKVSDKKTNLITD